jgi:hypothetical protein
LDSAESRYYVLRQESLRFSIRRFYEAGQVAPLDTGFTNLQNLFTGTVAKVGSLIAIVVGGYHFAQNTSSATNNAVLLMLGNGDGSSAATAALRRGIIPAE